MALALRSLGRLALDEGRHAEARSLLEADLRIERELDNRVGLPWGLSYLGWLAIIERDYMRAADLLEEGIGLCRQLGDREGIGRHLFLLAHLALDGGDYGSARLQFAESLSIFAELGYKYGLAGALQGLADVAMTEGDSVRGLRLAGSVAALRELTGAATTAEFRARHERRLARARSALPHDVASAAWTEGRAMSLDESTADALAVTSR